MPEFLVIVGPIASGKSTVAGLLADRVRARGRLVAVLDLDDVVDSIGGFTDLDEADFRRAQEVYGALVAAWLRGGVDVIAHGPFFERQERAALLQDVPDGTVPRFVQLGVTIEVALERVARDPSRMLSRHPELVRRFHERADGLSRTMPAPEWAFDTTVTSAERIADELAQGLLA